MESTQSKSIKTRKSSKYVFTVKNINTEKIDKNYGITLTSNISHNVEPPTNTTTITELTDNDKNTSLDIVSFLDESKRLYQCNVSMIDFSTGKNADSLKGYKCYWCRHSFTTTSIGCPIRYISSNVTKRYHSEVSKDDYTINENITTYKNNLMSNINLFVTKNKATLTINKGNYYETDGIFCSFNCCKAFIKDNKHINLYELSENLLIKLYTDMNESDIKSIKINPAPHWRLLKDYGGYLTIEQFRDNFNKSVYEFCGTIKSHNIFKPIGMLYEEKINF